MTASRPLVLLHALDGKDQADLLFTARGPAWQADLPLGRRWANEASPDLSAAFSSQLGTGSTPRFFAWLGSMLPRSLSFMLAYL